MKDRFIFLTVVILLISSALGWAEQKVFTQTVKYVMGENESRQELRELATLEAKRQILEQVGVYIEGTTELKQRITETGTEFKDETEYKKEVLAITAGVTNTEIAAEEWKEEDGVFVLYLTCRISVDTEDINRKIQELVRDRQKLDDMRMLQDEVARLQSEMEELRQKLEQAEASQVEEIKKQRHRLSDKYSAVEWNEKGIAIDDPDKEIEYYSYAIEQNPDWSTPYINRGNAYCENGYYDLAIADFNRVIQIDPNFAFAYYLRGFTHWIYDHYDLAIADYNRAIQINPNYAVAFEARGLVYYNRRDFNLAIADFNKAIQINPDNADSYYNRGIAYWYGLRDRINARRSFQRAKELGHPDAQKELDKLQ